MNRILSAAFFVSTAVMLAGCPSGTGAVIPGATGVGGTTTTPGGTTTTPTTGAAACTQNAPTGNPEPGTSIHGAYDKQLLPATWAATYKTEADVTAAFKAQEGGASWNCMLKFYPGATTVYAGKK